MSRLIDADALKDVFKKFVERDKQIHAWMSLIDKQPTVDAVEVVRCKDCEFAEKVDSRKQEYKCTNICRDGCTQWLSSKDYCSYGDRKESVKNE